MRTLLDARRAARRRDASGNGPRNGPPDGYALRRATLLDLRAVRRLERVIFPKDAYPYPDLALLFLSPGVINLKIVAPDGRLAAYAAGSAALFTRERAWIITIGTARDHQRRGLGRWLLAHMERRLRRPCIRLTVRESNHPAINLYARTGYVTVRTHRRYYNDGENGLIMEKCIDRPTE